MADFARFSNLLLGRPEPVQNHDSHNFLRFWDQRLNLLTFLGFRLAVQDPPECMILPGFMRFYLSLKSISLIFRGFSLAAQNTSRMHDFSRIHLILCDFEANGWFCPLFDVLAWPPRTPPECMITRIHLIFCDLEANGWFSLFSEVSAWPPSMCVFGKLHAVVCDLEANGWFCLRLQRLPVAPRRPVSAFCNVFRSVAAYSLQVAIARAFGARRLPLILGRAG